MNAGIYYWDTNDTTTGAGDTPTGTWGTGHYYWNSDQTGEGNGTFIATPGAGDNLYFVANPGTSSGANAYTVTVSGTQQSAYGLTFQSSGAATLSGSTIKLYGGGITVPQYTYGTTPQGAVTISAPIALQGTQMWTNNSSNAVTIGGSVTNGANTLTVAGPGNTIISGIIGSGSGGLVKTGTGTLTLQGANGFTGATTISSGTLNLASGGALQGSTVAAPTAASIVFDQSVASRTFSFGGLSGAGNVVLENNASSPEAVALTVGGNNGSASYSGALSGSGSLTKVGSGTLILSGGNSYTGGTTVSAGVLKVASAGALSGYSTASVTVSNGAALTLSVGGSGWTSNNIGDLLSANYDRFASGSTLGIDTTNASFPYASAISGSMGLTKLGANTLTLTAANTYIGPTTVGGGTLQLGDGTSGHDGSLASVSIINNAALVYNLYGSQSYSGVISGFGTLTKAGSGTLTLEGASAYSGLTTISGGTLQLGDGTSGHDGSLSSTGGVTNNAGLVFNLAGSQTYSGAISGTGYVTKTGAGTLTLSGANNYSGGTTVSAGTLAVTSAGALAHYDSASVTVSSGATLSLSVGGSGWSTGNVDNLLSANGSSSDSGSFLGFDTSNAGTSGFPYGSDIAAQYVGLKKLGAGVLILSGSNTYTGSTVVAGGTLVLAKPGALPAASTLTVNSGATLSLAIGGSGGWWEGDVYGLLSAKSGGFASGSALGIDTTNASLTYTYSISGNIGLTKLGLNNTLTLSAANTFNGSTTISGGTLDLAHGNALQGSTLIAPTAGTVVFDQAVSSHTFTLGGLSGPGDITLQDSAATAIALSVGGNNTNTMYSGSLGGPGSLNKIGTGTLTLVGASTHTDGTTISAGTLQLGNGINGQDGSLPASGGITNNATLVYNLVGSQTYSGIITGTGSLAKTGPGTLALSGTNNNYSGGTTVNAGTLAVATTGALANYNTALKVTVANGATLALNVGGSGWNATDVDNLLSVNGSRFASGSALGMDTTNAGTGGFPYGSNITQSMGLTKLGENTLTLSGTNTYSGRTVVAGGVLALTNAGALSSASTLTVNSGATLALRGWTAGDITSLLSANSGGFASGSVLAIDTTTAGLSYANSITGNMGLTKLGSNTLTLSAANTFAGPTIVSGGTLSLANGNALRASTLIAPTSGSILFDASVSPTSFTLGGLSGSGNLSLQNTSAAAVALTVGGNHGNTTYSGALSGPGSLTKVGMGTLTYTGTGTYSGNTTLNGGALALASSGSLSSTSANLYVGKTGPAALSIQDSASVSVGGELDVNYQNTSGSASTLVLQSGSLTVTGQTYVGRAAMQTGPSNLSAAVYQSGGTATLTGLLTVGYAGTAFSFFDLGGGTLNAGGGLLVGGNPTNTQGNGLVNVHGSGILNVNGSGLVVGQDSSLATSGNLNLAGGQLNIGTATYSASLTLGSKGGLASFSRSGGTMYVKGDLQVGGIATLTLDGSDGSVATSFGHTLTRLSSGGAPAPGLLVVVPYTGNLGTTEAISFGTAPTLVNGIIGPWIVTQSSGAISSGDFVTVSSHNLGTFSSYNDGFSGAGSTSVVSVSSASSTKSTNTATVHAMKVSDTATINSNQKLTISSGGLILNGGTIAGGAGSTLAFGSAALVFAGTNNAATISSAIQTTSGLVKYGPGSLVLSGDNSKLTGGIVVGSGTLNIQHNSALGPGGAGNAATVAAGASLEIQGGVAVVGNVPVTINGSGVGGGGALRNVEDDNTMTGTVSLGSDAQISTAADTTLTLAGGIQANTYNLLKTGSGTLALTGNSNAFLGSATVAEGILALQNSNSLGSGGGSVVVNYGAAVAFQGGVTVPALPFAISGTGTDNNGALQSQGTNSFAGPITLASDSQVNVNSSSSLNLSGIISGSYGLTKAGSGALVLSGTNTFTGALSALDGTLSTSSVNNAGSNGPLGAGTSPVTLGSSGKTAVLQYTGTSSGSTDRAWTLAAGGTGTFQVDQSAASVTLSGPISGNGGLKKTGSGTLTLSGTSNFTGTTTVSGGTLAIGSAGSLSATSSILIGPGTLQLTAGSGNQLPDGSTVTLAGGNFVFIGNGTSSTGEAVGALVLNVGHNSITTSRGSGSTYTPYLHFTSGPGAHTTGATVNYYSDANSSIQFQANPPALSNGILGGFAFFSDGTSAHADFATVSSSSPYTVQRYTGYGDNPATATPTTNLCPVADVTIAADKSINSLNLTGSYGVTITSGTLTLGSGGLIANTTSTGGISGGTLSAGNGELVVNTVHDLTISSAIGAATALVKTGSANLKLTSTSAIVGSIYLNQGTLEYAPTSTATYSGVISGTGDLLKSGSATLTLSGNNTYTGTTTASEGTLCVNGSLAAGSAVNVQGGTLSGTGTVSGNVTVSDGTIAFGTTGANIAGTVSATSGVLTVGQMSVGDYLKTAGGVIVGGNATLTAGSSGAQITGSLNYTSSANSAFSGIIAGSGKTVTLNAQTGTPTLTLSGSNTYTGGTDVERGTLQIGNTNALGSGGLIVGANGVLDLNTRSVSVPSLTGVSGGVITDNASGTGTSVLTVNIASPASSVYRGDFADGTGRHVELAKSGSGTLTIGNVDYAGGLTVSAGTLIADSICCDTLTIGSGASVTIAETQTNSAAFAMSYSAQASSEVVSSATGSIAVPEPGTLMLVVAGLAVLGVGTIRPLHRGRRTTA